MSEAASSAEVLVGRLPGRGVRRFRIASTSDELEAGRLAGLWLREGFAVRRVDAAVVDAEGASDES